MFGGGGPFATANPIDFAQAFKGFANVGDNPTVFAIVLSLFALYLILLIWARRTDLKDLIKVNTACKKYEVIWSVLTDHVNSVFLKAVFHNFYLLHS